jgi:hypothetical protein
MFLAEALDLLVDTQKDIFHPIFDGLLYLGPDLVYCGLHLLSMYVCLGFHCFLSGHCPGLVDIHPGDESTSKYLKLLVIGVYHGFHLFLIGVYLGINLFLVCFHLGQNFFFQVFLASFHFF